MHKKKIKEQDHLIKEMAPRRLPTPYVLQRFPLFNSKLEQILATSLREEQEQREQKQRMGEERFWHNNTTLRIDVK
jgi:hypothetical protein